MKIEFANTLTYGYKTRCAFLPCVVWYSEEKTLQIGFLFWGIVIPFTTNHGE